MPYKTNEQPYKEPLDEGQPPHLVPDNSDWEPNKKGQGRCENVNNGVRCRNWARVGSRTCTRHGGSMKHEEMAQGRYGGALAKGTLHAAYVRHLQDDKFRDLRDELAMMRAFTEAATTKLANAKLEDLSPTATAVVMTMIAEVRALVEATARIDQKISLTMTITDLYGIAGQIFEVISRYVQDPAVLRLIAADVENLRLTPPQSLGTPGAPPAGHALTPLVHPPEQPAKDDE